MSELNQPSKFKKNKRKIAYKTFIVLIVIMLLPFINMFLGKQIWHQNYFDCKPFHGELKMDCKTRVTICRCFGYSYYSGWPGIGYKCMGWEMMCRENVYNELLPFIL